MGMLIDGIWSEKDKTPGSDGKFVRPDSIFRNWVTLDGSPGPTGDGGYKAEAGRYHLYISHNCPWAYRTFIIRRLKGLEDIISLSIASPTRKEQGWTFTNDPGAIVTRSMGRPICTKYILKLTKIIQAGLLFRLYGIKKIIPL